MFSISADRRRRVLNFLIATAFVYFATCLFLYINQRSFIYFPDRTTPAPEQYGVPYVDVITVTTQDGLTLHGWYHPPATPEMPVVVLFHGNASHHGLRSFKAAPLIARGYGYLLAGYRGYGGNPGRPSEQGLYHDGRAYIDWLIEQQGIAPDRIVLSGESLGSGVVIQLATEYPGFAGIILETPFTSLPDLARRQFFMFPVGLLMKDQFRNLEKIGQIETVPLFILHGQRDTIVPLRFARQLYQAANEPKTLTILPHSGHNDMYMHGAAEKVLEFLQQGLE